jgi:hypothetical protein
VYLALLVVSQSLWVEVLDDLLWRVIFLDLALKVEADHVARADLARQFEELSRPLLFRLFDVLGRHAHDKVHIDVIMVFLVILTGTQHGRHYVSRQRTYLDHTIALLTNHGF